MGTVNVLDQNGNPVWGIPIRLGTRGSTPFGSTTYHEQHIDRAGHTDLEYPARGICDKLQIHYAETEWTYHLNFNEGFNPDWHNYESKSVDVNDINAPLTITLQKSGGQPQPNTCPVNFDKGQFQGWFNSVKVGSGPSQANMVAMKPALEKCGFEWQNMCRDSSQWRPRIHQPPFLNGPCSGSTHDVDCGPDEHGGWVLTFRY